MPMEDSADCPHHTLQAVTFAPPVQVPGVGALHDLYGVYWCPACGDTFNFEAGLKRLPPSQLLVMAHGLLALHARITTRPLTPNAEGTGDPDGVSTDSGD
jgi:hypothetical protein